MLDVHSSYNEQGLLSGSPSSRVDVLSIGRSSLTSFGVGCLCRSLCHPFCAVPILYLSYCGLDDTCVKCIVDIITQTKITELYLYGNNITDKGAESLCSRVVEESCTVTYLDLRYNELITDEYRERLRGFVRTHKRGVELDI